MPADFLIIPVVLLYWIYLKVGFKDCPDHVVSGNAESFGRGTSMYLNKVAPRAARAALLR